VTDLERLIRERQESLRGRPHDWIDDFADWRRRADWIGVAMIVGAGVIALLAVWLA
jgi:hypothetical protein